MSKVLIGIPIRNIKGKPMWRTQDCLDMLKAETQHAVSIVHACGQQITQNSMSLCLQMLREGWDYLLYTGDDITFPPYALDQLIAHDKDIIAGVCTYKDPPYWTTGVVEVEDGGYRKLLVTRETVSAKSVVELDAVGSGFMLVSRKAMEAVDDYLKNVVYPAIPEEFRWMCPVPYFPVTYDPTRDVVVGSDYSFCKLAKKAGMKIWIDCGLICGHTWEDVYDVQDHWSWIDKYGFSDQHVQWPGQQLDTVAPPTDEIYWGKSGGPMDITVTSVGNEYHAYNNVFPILKSRYSPLHDLEEAGKTSAGYIIGFHCLDKNYPAQSYLDWAKRFHRCLIHWTGTDITRIEEATTKEQREVLDNGHFVHLCEDERLVPELKAYFKDPRVVLMPVSRAFPIAPMPATFTVFVYYYKERHDFHYGDVIKGVIEAMPDVQFRLAHLFGDAPTFGYSNMQWLGNLDEQNYALALGKSSCMLRLSEHDGNPTSCREAAIMGRRIITNFEFDGAWTTDKVPTVQSVVEIINAIKDEKEPDLSIAALYRRKNDFVAYRKKIAMYAGIGESDQPVRIEIQDSNKTQPIVKEEKRVLATHEV